MLGTRNGREGGRAGGRACRVRRMCIRAALDCDDIACPCIRVRRCVPVHSLATLCDVACPCIRLRRSHRRVSRRVCAVQVERVGRWE